MVRHSILLLILFLTSTSLHAQWMQTGGPNMGVIRCLGSDGMLVYAGAVEGGVVYRSLNSGVTWNALGSGQIGTTQDRIYTIVCAGTDVYIGTDKGVYRSADSGVTWKSLNTGLGISSVYSIVVRGSNLWLLTNGNAGIFHSSNAGANWYKVNASFLSNTTPTSIAFNGSYLFVGTTSNGLHRSPDSGITWSPIDIGSSNTRYEADVPIGNTVFVRNMGNTYRSMDDGVTWMKISSAPTSSYKLYALDSIGTNLIAWYNNEFYRSSDNGITWAKRNTDSLTKYFNVSAFTINGSEMYIGTNGGGVLRSPADFSNWVAVNSGLTYAQTNVIKSVNNTLFAASLGRGIIWSSDNGTNWYPANVDGSMGSAYAMDFEGPNLYAAARFLLRSTNSGLRWDRLTANTNGEQINAIGINGTSVVIGAHSGIFTSTDSGASWSLTLAGDGSYGVAAFINSGTDMMAATDRYIYRSVDKGNTWSTDSIVRPIATFATNSSYLFAANNQSILRSADGGITWTVVDNGLPDNRSGILSLCTNDSNVFAGIDRSGVFYSLNNGASWTDVSTGLGDKTVRSLAIQDGYIYAATNLGVWRRPLSEVLGISDVQITNAPSGTASIAAYPNPASNTSTIRYTLPVRSVVTVSITDALGRTILTPVSNTIQEASEHQVSFSTQDLAPGIYLCRLQAADREAWAKLIIAR